MPVKISLTRCCLSGTSYATLVTITCSQVLHASGSAIPVVRIITGRDLQAYFVAIPLHLASRLSATRSPRRRWRAFPRTVATCLTGSKESPSFMCQFTLCTRLGFNHDGVCWLVYVLAPKLTKYLGKEGTTSEHCGLFPLSKKKCSAFCLPNDIAPIIKGWRVLDQPVIDLAFPTWRQQVLEGHL